MLHKDQLEDKSAGAIEYIDCISGAGWDPPQVS